MARKRQLFILVSQTQTGIARMIRGICKYPYNHVSVTLDPSLRRWYSFARYVQDAPLYGGLVSETPRRLCAPEGDILVRAYRVEIPEQTAARLEGLLALADDPASGLIYNHLDLPLTAITEFEEKGKTDPMFAELDRLCKAHNNLWNSEAEKYLLANAKKI